MRRRTRGSKRPSVSSDSHENAANRKAACKARGERGTSDFYESVGWHTWSVVKDGSQ